MPGPKPRIHSGWPPEEHLRGGVPRVLLRAAAQHIMVRKPPKGAVEWYSIAFPHNTIHCDKRTQVADAVQMCYVDKSLGMGTQHVLAWNGQRRSTMRCV